MKRVEWYVLGESQRYRQLPLYSLAGWTVTHDDFVQTLVLPCPFGGPICVLGRDASPQSISLYSSRAELISTFVPDAFRSPNEQLVPGGAGWTGETDILVLVSTRGVVSLIEASSLRQGSFSLEINSLTMSKNHEQSLILASIHDDHLVVLVSDGTLICCYSLSSFFGNFSGLERRVRVAKFRPSSISPGSQEGLYSGLQVPDAHTRTSFRCVLAIGFTLRPRRSEIVAMTSHADGRIVRTELFSNTETTQIISPHQYGPFCCVASSPSGTYWALANWRGELFLVKEGGPKFDVEPLLLFGDSPPRAFPSQLCFCQDDEGEPPAVACSFVQEGVLLLARSQDDWLKFEFATGFALTQEMDGARIITSQSHEILVAVSRALVQTLQIGSAAPSAVLLDAMETTGDASGFEVVRALKQERQLWPAVSNLIHCALDEFYGDDQTRFLAVASRSKVFLSDSRERRMAAKAFAKACLILRVLNVVRASTVGLAITLRQFVAAGDVSGLCLRLARWKFFFVAQRILQSVHLLMSERKRLILEDRLKLLWAREVIRSRFSDNASLVMDRIARIELRSGYHLLAKMWHHQKSTFNDQESKVVVPVREEHFQLASGDESRKSTTVGRDTTKKWSSLPSDALGGIVAMTNKDSTHIQDEKTLGALLLIKERDFKKRIVRAVEMQEFELALDQARTHPDREFRAYVQSASSIRPIGSTPPSTILESEMRIRFAKDQLAAEERVAMSAVGTSRVFSVADACRELIVQTGDEREADRMAKDLGLSKNTLWAAKVRAFISRRDWDRLRKLASERPARASIVVDECARNGFHKEALNLLASVPDIDDRLDCLMRLKEFTRAVDLVKSSRSGQINRDWALSVLRLTIQTDPTLSDSEREDLLLRLLS